MNATTKLGVALLLGLAAAGVSAMSRAQAPQHAVPANLYCPGDTVVWVNTRSGVYHFRGER